MPLFDIKTETGEVIRVEHPQAPTVEEAQAIIASLPAASSEAIAPVAPPSQEDQLRQAITEQAQQGISAKAGGLGAALANALIVNPGRSLINAYKEHPVTAFNPFTAGASTVEAGRTSALDLSQIINNRLASILETAKKNPIQSVLSPASLAVKQGQKDLTSVVKQLIPYTPGEPELDQAVRDAILAQEVEKEKNATPQILTDLGARKNEANFIADVAPYLIGGPEAKAAIPPKIIPKVATAITETGEKLAASLKPSTVPQKNARLVRSALKPKNSNLGKSVEKAAESELNDVFTVNPNADTAAASPLEGFSQSISTLENQVGKQIDVYRNQVGKTLNAGDQLATKLREKAAALKRQGAPADDVAYLESRANDFEGALTTMEDLQGGVTTANRNRTPFFQKNFAAQNPARANADNILNEIIGTEGGKIINSELEAVGGAEGAAIRKKWGNLNTLRNQSEERLSKLINNAPEGARSKIVETLSSPAGAAGLFALVNGWSAGVLPIAAVAIKTWAKNASKELKNSDRIIENLYKTLRKNPPEGGFTVKPPILGTATEAVPKTLSLEELIQERIKSYPPEFQKDKRLARIAAESEVSQQLQVAP